MTSFNSQLGEFHTYKSYSHLNVGSVLVPLDKTVLGRHDLKISKPVYTFTKAHFLLHIQPLITLTESLNANANTQIR